MEFESALNRAMRFLFARQPHFIGFAPKTIVQEL